jgi:hypothetical protein
VTTEIGLATREHQSFSPREIGPSSNRRRKNITVFLLGSQGETSFVTHFLSLGPCLPDVMIRTTLFLTHSKREREREN